MFFKLFGTALICASLRGQTETVKILVEQEGIDIIAKSNVYFNNLIFGISSNYLEQHLCVHLIVVTKK